MAHLSYLRSNVLKVLVTPSCLTPWQGVRVEGSPLGLGSPPLHLGFDWLGLGCNEFKRSLKKSPLRGVNVVNFPKNLPYRAKKCKWINPLLYIFVYVNSKKIAMEPFTQEKICVTTLTLEIVIFCVK